MIIMSVMVRKYMSGAEQRKKRKQREDAARKGSRTLFSVGFQSDKQMTSSGAVQRDSTSSGMTVDDHESRLDPSMGAWFEWTWWKNSRKLRLSMMPALKLGTK